MIDIMFHIRGKSSVKQSDLLHSFSMNSKPGNIDNLDQLETGILVIKTR